jgi:hypothetical protein
MTAIRVSRCARIGRLRGRVRDILLYDVDPERSEAKKGKNHEQANGVMVKGWQSSRLSLSSRGLNGKNPR